jgi:hypothetical protein
VIIDWHSHQAHEEVANATKFFTEMAQKWGKYDHVIFELFNEPKEIEWSTVKSYAEKIVPVIRQYSDNLILVGNPMWDQNPQYAIGNTVSGDNIAYTFHYYANSHCWNGQTEWGTQCEGDNAQQAINAGLSVFVSEWGTGNSDGGGNPDVSRNTSWQDWMNKNQLSWANWSASKVEEGTAAFSSGSSRNSLQFTTSGNMVKGYLASNPTSYTACADGGSNGGNGSSEGNDGNGANEDVSAIVTGNTVPMGVQVSGKTLLVSGVKTATVSIFDMQGRVVLNGPVSGSMNLEGLNPGAYVLRVSSGSQEKIFRTQIK